MQNKAEAQPAWVAEMQNKAIAQPAGLQLAARAAAGACLSLAKMRAKKAS